MRKRELRRRVKDLESDNRAARVKIERLAYIIDQLHAMRDAEVDLLRAAVREGYVRSLAGIPTREDVRRAEEVARERGWR